MKPDDLERALGVFRSVVARPAADRASYLRSRCANPDEFQFVTSLLAHHEDDSEATLLANAPPAASPVTLSPGSILAGRFQLLEWLGAGSFGTVWKALDLKDPQSPVALKLLRALDPPTLYRFKQEFRRLADVDHPNLVKSFELYGDHVTWFFTMKLVHGQPMVAYIRESLSLDAPLSSQSQLERLRHSFVQLAGAVTTLHAAQLQHGDLKPDNVLVSADGLVHVLDFGLVRRTLSKESLQANIFAGTPDYIAPEQIVSSSLNAKSDWYSFGVMLFKALTGRLPFEGTGFDVLLMKCQRDPSFPDGDWGSPPIVDLCLRLLHRDPDARPAAGEIVNVLTPDRPAPARAATPKAPSVFSGREQELQALTLALCGAPAGTPACVHLSGPSSIGKSALAREFVRRVLNHSPDTVVLQGRCYEAETVPFKAFDEIVDALARYLAGIEKSVAVTFLPRDLPLLAQVFPIMQQFSSFVRLRPQPVEQLESQDLRRRAVSALKELFARLADRHQLFLWIDDLQWTDTDSQFVLEELLKPPGAPSFSLLLSYRSEAPVNIPPLAVVGTARHIDLGPLPMQDACDLARGISPGLSQAEIESIAREADGNPLFVQQLAHSAFGRTEYPTSLGLTAFIQRNLLALHLPLRRLVEVISVAGQPLPIEIASRITTLGIGDLRSAAAIRTNMLLRFCGSQASSLDTYHDKIREAVLGSMSESAIEATHLELGHALQQAGLEEPERLLRHFGEGQDFASGFTYALEAADTATRCLAFHRAVSLFRTALDFQARLPSPQVSSLSLSSHEIRCRLANALADGGRAREASELFLELAADSTADAASDFRYLAAVQTLRTGEIDRGLNLLRSALRAFRFWVPSHNAVILAAVICIRSRIWQRGFGFRQKNENDIAPAVLRRLDRLWTAGLTLTFDDPLLAAYLRSRYTLLALSLGEPHRVSLALAAEAFGQSMMGAGKRSVELLQMAQGLADHTNRAEVKGVILLSNAGSAFFTGRLSESIRSARQAEDVLQTRGQHLGWEIAHVRAVALDSLALTGHIHDFNDLFRRATQEAQSGNDEYALFLSAASGTYLTFIADDAPADSHRNLDQKIENWGRRKSGIPFGAYWYGKIETFLYEMNARAAWAFVVKHWAAIQRSSVLGFPFQGTLGRHARARAAIASYVYVDRNEKWLQEADRFVKRTAGSPLAIGQAWSTVVDASVAACHGNFGLAQAKLTSAQESFRDLGFDNYVFAASYRRGQILGGASGRDLKLAAEASAKALGISNCSRYVEMLIPGIFSK